MPGGSGGRGRGRGRGGTSGSSSRPTPGTSSSKTKKTPASHAEPPEENEHHDNEELDKEATEADMIELGMRVVGAMTEEDMEIFLDRLFTECPMTDKMFHNSRCSNVNWEAVGFGAFGAEECQAAWFYLRTGTRKYRIMAEMVQEVRLTLQSSNLDRANYQKKMLESAPGFPKKPTGLAGGFQMFCTEMWAMKPANSGEKNFIMFQSECQDLFKSLSKEQQDKFQHKADLARAEYVKQVKEFYIRHPGLTTLTTVTSRGSLKRIIKGKEKEVKPVKLRYTNVPVPPLTPHLLFIQTKLNKLEDPPTREELPDLKAKYKAKWNSLSDRKKSKWIEKCVNKSQNFLLEMSEYRSRFPEYVAKDFKIRKRISKEELEIWERCRGRPTRPPLTVFDTYFLEFCKRAEYAKLPKDDCKELVRDKWNALDYYHKEMYKVNLRKQNLGYKRDLERYFENVPNLMKPLVLENLPKRIKNSLLTVDKGSEIEIEDSKQVEIVDIGDSQSEGGDEEIGDNLTEEAPVKKRKKKKRIHAEAEKEESEKTFPDDNMDDSESNVKKKKRKRKHIHEEEGDVAPSFENHFKKEEDDGVLVFKRELDGDDQNIILKERKKVHETTLQPNRSKPIQKSSKPKVEFMKPEKTFKSQHSYDVIRGIFDARQGIGRCYSVFYYYAKYVAKEVIWIQKIECIGLAETAEQIYRTFLNLSKHQKQIFIDQSYKFHSQSMKDKEVGYEDEDFNGKTWDKSEFPGEPKPPPKTAKHLYMSEVRLRNEKKKKKLVFPKWNKMDENKQKFYLKKLYRISNIYLKEYEEFVQKMSPSDLVAYTVKGYGLWENRYMRLRASRLAKKGFTFPLPKRQLNGLERDPLPEIIDEDELKRRIHRESLGPEREFPFDDEELINAITDKVQTTDDQVIDDMSEHDSDSASEEELLTTDHRRRNLNKKVMEQNEIKRVSMFMYPI